MRALLNSLGLTLWSSIAIVLAVGLAMVGYRVSTVGHPTAGVAPAPPFPSVQPERGALAQQEAESSPQQADIAQPEAGPSQRETESNESIGAGTDVRPGQLYSAGDYQKAVDAITRGLKKGSIVHLDEAYVYLGLAQQKLGNIAEAQQAFARLQDVPNISPKI
jgi:tetratricopeptide (TPR) repeat protein